MDNNGIKILSTRPVDGAAIEMAASKNIVVETISFIETTAIVNDALQQQIDTAKQQECNVVFTSMNAVEAVADLLKGSQPAWNIFCMGNTTKELLIEHFGRSTIIATASNAMELSNKIIAWANQNKSSDAFLFFCGDQRREELPGNLRKHGIALEEIITYKTIQTPTLIDLVYDAVLFFSPSAVHSFFSINKAAGKTVFFAIGETTGDAIKQYGVDKIMIGSTAVKQQLLMEAIEFFTPVSKY